MKIYQFSGILFVIASILMLIAGLLGDSSIFYIVSIPLLIIGFLFLFQKGEHSKVK